MYAVDLTADASIIAAGSPEGVLRLSDARSPEKSFKLRGHTDNIRSAQPCPQRCSPDNFYASSGLEYVAFCGHGDLIHVTAFCLMGKCDNHSHLVLLPCRAIVLNEHGTLGLSASSDNTIKLWDIGEQMKIYPPWYL